MPVVNLTVWNTPVYLWLTQGAWELRRWRFNRPLAGVQVGVALRMYGCFEKGERTAERRMMAHICQPSELSQCGRAPTEAIKLKLQDFH